MEFQSEPGVIRWRLHFRSPPPKVFAALATDDGRERYWAEKSETHGNAVTFHFENHPPTTGRVLTNEPPSRFCLTYFDTVTTFTLDNDGSGGTDLTLEASEVPESIKAQMVPGWVSVLMAMKAAVDFDIDLRNHDAGRSWQNGYCDN